MKPLSALFTAGRNDAEDYAVVRVTRRRHTIVQSGFTSREAAQTFALHKSKATGIAYRVERVADIPDTDTETPQASPHRKKRKPKRGWFSKDLIGLGIPAQWGKGRRSRKGDYLP
jgi:hypothetical protein